MSPIRRGGQLGAANVSNGKVVKWIAAITAVNVGIVLALTQCAVFEDIRPATGLTRETTGPYGSYLAARHATNLRDAAAAASYYRRALQHDPDNPVLVERALVSEVSSGNLDAASDLAEKLLKSMPTAKLPNLVIGMRSLRDAGYARARDAFSRITDDPPAEVTARIATAYAHFSEGNAVAARAALSSLEEFSGAKAFLLYHRAILEDLEGNPQGALQHFAQATSLSNGEAQRLVQAQGIHLARSGQAPQAIALFNGFLEKFPDNPVILNEVRRIERGETPARLVSNAREGVAETLYGVATNLAEDDAVEVPVFYLQIALALAPQHELSTILLAERLELAGRQEQASALYNRIPATSPIRAAAQRQIARIFVRREKPDEAARVLKAALDGTAEDVATWSALGDVHRGREDFTAAIEAYDRALGLIDKTWPRHWVQYYARGIAHERAGNWAAAEQDLKRSLTLRPNNPAVMNYLAYSWVDRGENIQQALEMLKQAVAASPEDGYIVDSLGWAYYRLGDYAQALRYLEKAVHLEPGQATINDHLGDVYWKVGRQQEARFQWQHALSLGPEKGEEPNIRRKLEVGLENGAAAPRGSAPD
jgi:tetratricopeptide (TPR) repeat protein